MTSTPMPASASAAQAAQGEADSEPRVLVRFALPYTLVAEDPRFRAAYVGFVMLGKHIDGGQGTVGDAALGDHALALAEQAGKRAIESSP